MLDDLASVWKLSIKKTATWATSLNDFCVRITGGAYKHAKSVNLSREEVEAVSLWYCIQAIFVFNHLDEDNELIMLLY